jgi:putative ABC transport system ATP-binding protein
MTDWVIEAEDLTKVYRMGEFEVHALCGVSMRVKPGEVIAIMGPSGSGKSTLMNILGCLDRPSSGCYKLDGQEIADLSDDELAEIRSHKVGFVFQSFNLLGRQTALTNVELPMRYAGVSNGRRKRAIQALEDVGLGDRIHHRPNELSGGQQQRVAIARALVNNLDTKSGEEIMDILLDLNEKFSTTLIFVTHDPEIAVRTERVIMLRDGLVESQPG